MKGIKKPNSRKYKELGHNFRFAQIFILDENQSKKPVF